MANRSKRSLQTRTRVEPKTKHDDNTPSPVGIKLGSHYIQNLVYDRDIIGNGGADEVRRVTMQATAMLSKETTVLVFYVEVKCTSKRDRSNDDGDTYLTAVQVVNFELKGIDTTQFTDTVARLPVKVMDSCYMISMGMARNAFMLLHNVLGLHPMSLPLFEVQVMRSYNNVNGNTEVELNIATE